MPKIILNPNEPNPKYMMYQESAMKIFIKLLTSNDDLFWLTGRTGMGKSTFLLWLKQVAPRYSVKTVFFHGGEGLKFERVKMEIEEAVKPSFFAKFFLRRKYTKKPLLILLDEVGWVPDGESEKIFRYIVSKLDDPDLRVGVVLSSIHQYKSKAFLVFYFRERYIETIPLQMPSKEVIMEMIKKRIKDAGGRDFEPFGEKMIENIIKKSNSPREILIKLEKLSEKINLPEIA
ncbi:MAG: hypothetical protein FE048_00340 [Thermoplasmata archaeon]|nr:MAG: hypothetical protein FE048_00340 [Thermoplasmata archaeon]